MENIEKPQDIEEIRTPTLRILGFDKYQKEKEKEKEKENEIHNQENK